MTIIGKCLYRFTDRNNTIKMQLFLTALFLSLRKHFLINGYYRFTTNDVGTFAVIKKSTPGDVNKDGIFDVNDVTLLQIHIANKTDLNGLSLIEESDIVLVESIDMIKDNVLDILDVTELMLEQKQ